MTTKKSKPSAKSAKEAPTKSKTTATTAKKPEIEAVKTKTVGKTTEAKSFMSGFFAKKYEENESILTVFKHPKFYGALLGEVLGTMLLALLFLSAMLMGIPSVATYVIAVIAILIAVYAFSRASLNPIITAGLMATRHISVIRGVMYIVAEVLGAWLGWLIFNGFHLVGGEAAYDVPTMATVGENMFWPFAMVEILGAIIIAFCFARALKYKRSVFTFGAVVSGGIVLAILVGYVVSAAFLRVSNNFVMNPAIAMMLQIFPSSGADFGEIFGGICQALSLYAILPMLGGVVGFYLAEFSSRLAGEE